MTSDKFRYRPLGENQIRFVSFQPVEAEAECEGKAMSPPDSTLLDCYLYRGPRDMQDLVALSYVWGPKENVENISLNGYEINIQANLKAALIAIRKQRPTILLWMDALCINQDNNDEKSIEVGRMRDIYRNAKQVIAWLGPPENSSDDLIMKMTQAGSTLRSPFTPVVIVPIAMRSAWSSMSDRQKRGYMMSREACQHDWCEGTWTHFFIHFTISDNAEASLPKSALEAFFKRPFWRRAWIIQEFSLAKDLYFQIGESCLSLEDFLEVRILLQQRKTGIMSISDYSDRQKLDEIGYYDHLFAQASTLVRFRRQVQESKPMKIENLIIGAFVKHNEVESFEATDARDRVYGLLGLATNCAIRSDYSKTCAEVYTEVAELMLSKGITDLMQYTIFPKKVPNMPSWVPDWSSTNKNMLRDVDMLFEYNAKDSSTHEVDCLDFATSSKGIRQLRIAGVVLGELAHILPPYVILNDDDDEGFQVFTRFTNNIEQTCLYGCRECHEVQHKPAKVMIARVICANEVIAVREVTPLSPSRYQAYYDDIRTKDVSDQNSIISPMAWAFGRSVLTLS